MTRKLLIPFLMVGILIVIIAMSGCWINKTVDKGLITGYYASMEVSPNPSWILPFAFDTGIYSYPLGVQIDSTGTLYAVVNHNNDIYLWSRPFNSSWSATSIGAAVNPSFFSISTDKNNYLHVAYIDFGAGQNLRYMTNTFGGWTDMLANSDACAFYTNIRVDSGLTPHIVYYDQTLQVVRHSSMVSNSWGAENVGAGFNAPYCSMDMTPDGRIHVASMDTVNNQLLYSVKSGSNWSTQTVTSIPNIPYYTYFPTITIRVTPSGAPHIVYYQEDSTLHYAYKSGSTWITELVDNNNLPGSWGSQLQLDFSGIPHIIYNRDDTNELCYASRNNSNWDIEVLDKSTSGSAYRWPALAFGITGNLEIVNANQSNNQAYNYITKAKWVNHISYYDATSTQVKYATVLPGDTFTGGFLGYESVDTAVGDSNTAIAVDSNGVPHIAFGDSSTGYYLFATRTAGQWVMETVGIGFFANSYGGNVSLAFGPNNIPQISYNDVSVLQYAIKSTGSWSTQAVDTSKQVLVFNSIAVDKNNLPLIAYTRSTYSYYFQPRLAQSNGTTWTIQSIDTVGAYNGFGISLALDKKGDPGVLWSMYPTAERYAIRRSGIWKLESIDTTVQSVYEGNRSLVFDDLNNPHGIYFDYGSYNLYHAQLAEKASHTWRREQINYSAGDGGVFASVGLRKGFLPSASYYYISSTGLNWGYNSPEFYSLPDIKVLLGQSISTAYNLLDYSIVSSQQWSPSAFNGIANITNSGALIGFDTTTAAGFAIDSVSVQETSDNNMITLPNVFKQSSFTLKKLPSVIAEGTTILENSNINVSNYLLKSGSYSGSTHWNVSMQAENSIDTTKLAPFIPPTGTLLVGTISSSLNGNVNLIVRASTDSTGADWDKEIVHVYPVLNQHSGFTTGSDTTQWAFQTPSGISTKPTITWQPGPGGIGGGFGSLMLSFTASNQGIKITPNSSNWVKTEPNQWYKVRALVQVDTSAGVNNQVNIYVFGFNGIPPKATDISAHVTLSAPTAWTWYETYIFSDGTSMYPQIQVKNNSTSSCRVKINKVEILKARPMTDMTYGTPHIHGSGETWDSASDTTRWGIEVGPQTSGLPTLSVSTGILDLNFAGDVYRGIKMTAASTPGHVRTYSWTTGKVGGMSMKYTYSGALSNSVAMVAIYGTDSVNSATIKDLSAYANVYHVASNFQNVIRTAYPINQPYGYQQIQFRNAAAGHFYVSEIWQEQDSDTDNYWDNGLFP